MSPKLNGASEHLRVLVKWADSWALLTWDMEACYCYHQMNTQLSLPIFILLRIIGNRDETKKLILVTFRKVKVGLGKNILKMGSSCKLILGLTTTWKEILHTPICHLLSGIDGMEELAHHF